MSFGQVSGGPVLCLEGRSEQEGVEDIQRDPVLDWQEAAGQGSLGSLPQLSSHKERLRN